MIHPPTALMEALLTSLSGYTHSSTGTYGTVYQQLIRAYTYVIDDAAMEGQLQQSLIHSLYPRATALPVARLILSPRSMARMTACLGQCGGITVSDTNADDTFTATSASLSGTDRDTGQTLTYSITGGSADTSLSGFTHSRTGTYGQLFVNSSTGAYRFIPHNPAVDIILMTGALRRF